ncbi:YbaY family lipoprotein [Deinococcus arenicola]|uniref:YbaY family lipoprotein n=1 Tax=Deinococcus arenicola TaxID=2994950 RepID=A0ABU4DTV3_9DEIO|nr:YbaY family lipoprotein [Deinococcus sp. ZS9-10]MDV6375855.1 YbaY family lipoprotein [Deinococcus sp. ZS9-10]
MNRFVSVALGLSITSLLLAPSALAQTQIGGVTLTPINPPASTPTPASSPSPAATPSDDYTREAIPSGYREVKGRVTGPSEGLRLPPGSQIMVSLVDLTAPASLVDIKFSTTRLSTPYQMVYNAVRINAAHKYAVRSTIMDASGKVLYRSADVALPDGARVVLNVPVMAR